MSYPPLRSWPVGQDEFPSPPKPPDHWFFRMRKWLWPAVLLIMGATVVGVCCVCILTGNIGQTPTTFIVMIALAVICLVAATIAGFALGLIEFGKLNYEHRVELIAGISSILFFAVGTIFELSAGWLLP